MKNLFILQLLFLVVLGSSSLWATSEDDLWNNLDEHQQALLHEGQQVLVVEEMSHYPWPYFHIYRLLPATPLQSASIFWDVEYAPHYIPNCLKVSINAHPASYIMEITYELKMPIFSKEISTVRDEVQVVSHGGYKISWDILSSKYSRSGRGSFLVVPHEGGALLCYSSFVHPGSSIASLLRKPAENRLQETVTAIADQIIKEVKECPEQLSKQEQELERSLDHLNSSGKN